MLKIKNATWKGQNSPRAWQPECYKLIQKHFKQKKPGLPIIQAIMGSGKSQIIAELARSVVLKPNEIVVITTTRLQIIDQFREIFEEMDMLGEVGFMYAAVNDVNESIGRIIVVCDQSTHKLEAYLKEENMKIKLLIPDEAHRTDRKTYIKFVNDVKPQFMLGFTATPYKAEHSSNLELFDKVIYKYESPRALSEKVIVPWRVDNCHVIDLKLSKRDQNCVDQIKKYEGQGVCNAYSIKDAERFNKLLLKNGVNSVVLHSRLTAKERRAIVKDFEESRIKCIVYINILSEGADMPHIDWLILRRKTGSRLRFVQEIGRALRTRLGKRFCRFYDPHDLFTRFEISYDECLGNFDFFKNKRSVQINNKNFDFTKYYYESRLHAENAIRNISTILKAYGLTLALDHQMYGESASVPLHNKFKGLCSGAKPEAWDHVLKEIDKKFFKMGKNYALEIVKILTRIKMMGFWPHITKDRIIKISEKQQQKIEEVNLALQKPHLYKGQRYTRSEICEEFNIPSPRFNSRIQDGWSIEDAIERPLRAKENGEAFIGRKMGVLTVVDVEEKGLVPYKTKYICICDCGGFIQRRWKALNKNKKCTCLVSKHLLVKNYKRTLDEVKENANLVGQTIKGYLITGRKRVKRENPNSNYWQFEGHCVKCGIRIKADKYNLLNRYKGCKHKNARPEREKEALAGP